MSRTALRASASITFALTSPLLSIGARAPHFRRSMRTSPAMQM